VPYVQYILITAAIISRTEARSVVSVANTYKKHCNTPQHISQSINTVQLSRMLHPGSNIKTNTFSVTPKLLSCANECISRVLHPA